MAACMLGFCSGVLLVGKFELGLQIECTANACVYRSRTSLRKDENENTF
jgi:hypothetical protein